MSQTKTVAPVEIPVDKFNIYPEDVAKFIKNQLGNSYIFSHRVERVYKMKELRALLKSKLQKTLTRAVFDVTFTMGDETFNMDVYTYYDNIKKSGIDVYNEDCPLLWEGIKDLINNSDVHFTGYRLKFLGTILPKDYFKYEDVTLTNIL